VRSRRKSILPEAPDIVLELMPVKKLSDSLSCGVMEIEFLIRVATAAYLLAS